MLLGEMRQGALEVDHADNARVTLAGATFAPSLPAVVGDLAAAHGGAILAHWRSRQTANTSSGIIPRIRPLRAPLVDLSTRVRIPTCRAGRSGVLTVAAAISGWVSQ